MRRRRSCNRSTYLSGPSPAAAGCACVQARACGPRRSGTAGAPRAHGCRHPGRLGASGWWDGSGSGLLLAAPPSAAASTARPRRLWTKARARRQARPLRRGPSAAVRACAWARAGDLPLSPAWVRMGARWSAPSSAGHAAAAAARPSRAKVPAPRRRQGARSLQLRRGFQNASKRLAAMKMQAAASRARMMWPSLSCRRSSRLLAKSHAQSCSTTLRILPRPEPCAAPILRIWG